MNRKKLKTATGSRRSAGFTLVELLVTVLLVVLAAVLIMGALSVSKDAYISVVDSANAQLLLSTTMTELRDELSIASDFSVSINAKSVSYTGWNGLPATISSTSGGIIISESSTGAPGGSDRVERQLVSKQAATANLHAEFDSISYSDGVFTISGLTVYKNAAAVTSIEEYKIAAG